MSETGKVRHLTLPYCHGNGVDIGSGGDPVVPWAIQVELGDGEYSCYNSGNKPAVPIQWRGSCWTLPFKPGTLDFVYSSHLIEDFLPDEQQRLFDLWTEPLKPGGYLVVVAPDRDLWNAAIAKGQPPNCSHKHEMKVGEMTRYAQKVLRQNGKLEVIRDSLAGDEYSILFIARKE